MHLNITIDWLNNDRSLDYMPLQLVLHSGGRSFILFGKANRSQSYLWRCGNHYGNDVGARYPDHVGDDARVIFTFDTNGAAIDMSSAYSGAGHTGGLNWDKQRPLYAAGIAEALLGAPAARTSPTPTSPISRLWISCRSSRYRVEPRVSLAARPFSTFTF